MICTITAVSLICYLLNTAQCNRKAVHCTALSLVKSHYISARLVSEQRITIHCLHLQPVLTHLHQTVNWSLRWNTSDVIELTIGISNKLIQWGLSRIASGPEGCATGCALLSCVLSPKSEQNTTSLVAKRARQVSLPIYYCTHAT